MLENGFQFCGCVCSFYNKFLEREKGVLMLRVEMRPFDGVARKAFEGPTNRRMRLSGQVMLVEWKAVPRFLMAHGSVQLSPAVKVQSCLH